MTELIQISKRRWIVFTLVIGCLVELRVHGIVWDYSSTDGKTTLSGQFETDGVFADTQGSGTHEFTLTKWTSWKFNNVDIVWVDAFGQSSIPVMPKAGNDSFTWNQGQNGVEVATDSAVFLDGVPFFQFGNSIRIAVWGESYSAQDTLLDDSRYVNLFGDPVSSYILQPSTTLTPVPEPVEFAIISLIGLGGFVIWRRRYHTVNQLENP